MSKFKYEIKEGALQFAGDPNEDGQDVVKGKLHLNEAIQEAFKKGEKVEGVKVADFAFDMTKLKIQIDTDQDGEHLLELEVDLAELVDETGLLK